MNQDMGDSYGEPISLINFIYRIIALIICLVLLAFAISFSGRWLIYKIYFSFQKDHPQIITITIGPDFIHIPYDIIRFPDQRIDGPAEHIDLQITWPELKAPLTQEIKGINKTYTDNLIILQLSQRTIAHDMSGRIEPIYRNLIEGLPYAGPYGLTTNHLKQKEGYINEVLFTAPRYGKLTYAVRCTIEPKNSLFGKGNCQRDIHVGRDLNLLYRFSIKLLPEWEKIDEAVEAFIKKHLQYYSE
ncbi:putative transmembrane anchored protein [Liberibacter crescens BT-1]|uniref:Putative transmembrane anchored protein n=1 Tax=Liberibacter crescens (strain BT-1) TaxID=1215343 RepID=L0EX52_LIBCB|nr:anchored protein [Liberibacter crescens]AGA65238.1 putative transmembrane anchored protein [Liberibacter crescens BT-1]AMC13181.1 hypothetical protein RL73_06295 [Liberibacter crescens]